MSTATARGRCRAGIDFDAAAADADDDDDDAAVAAELVPVADGIFFEAISGAGCKGGGAAGLFAERCAKHERNRPMQRLTQTQMHTQAHALTSINSRDSAPETRE